MDQTDDGTLENSSEDGNVMSECEEEEGSLKSETVTLSGKGR
jgi:hypothetical protein